MNPNSTPGSHVIAGKFCQTYFIIIKFYLLLVGQSFISGQEITKNMTHSSLIFLPKTENRNKLNDNRHIHLRNFL